MKVRYIGGCDEVELADTGLTFKRGDDVELSPQVVKALRLADQAAPKHPDPIWWIEGVSDTKTTKAKAAAANADDTTEDGAA